MAVLSPSRRPRPADRPLVARLALPWLLVGLVLCALGYLAAAVVVLRTLAALLVG